MIPNRDSVINAFNRFYEEALTKRWIKKPLSWALYKTWEWCDSVERAERKEE